jgi:hypothetical protein
MRNDETINILQQISLILGPLQAFIYIWLVREVLRATEYYEDKTARKRWVEAVFLNGGLLLIVVIFLSAIESYTISEREQTLNTLQPIYLVIKTLSVFLCVLLPAAFIGTMMYFSRRAPWFSKHKLLFPPKRKPNRGE